MKMRRLTPVLLASALAGAGLSLACVVENGPELPLATAPPAPPAASARWFGPGTADAGADVSAEAAPGPSDAAASPDGHD